MIIILILTICPSYAFTPNIVSSNNTIIKINSTTIESWKNLGRFKLTSYCSCKKCCGKSDGITYSGTKATANRTIAVDKRIIPIGTKVKIGNNIYIAEDIGGAIKGNKIDIYFPTHKQALEFGVQYSDVYIKE